MRIAYDNFKTYLNTKTDSLIVKKRGGGEKTIPVGKWWINRNTPVGDDADLYESKPHNGYRWIDPKSIVAVEKPDGNKSS